MSVRQYLTLKALVKGEIIEFEGLQLKKAEGDLVPGDIYIAERNGPPKLLTVGRINEDRGWVHPTTMDYPFNLSECVKVELVD